MDEELLRKYFFEKKILPPEPPTISKELPLLQEIWLLVLEWMKKYEQRTSWEILKLGIIWEKVAEENLFQNIRMFLSTIKSKKS